MLALIGHVDNLEEAFEVVLRKGYNASFMCGLPLSIVPYPAQYRVTDRGCELVGQLDTCEERFKIHVLVGYDQSVTELSRELVPGSGHCSEALPWGASVGVLEQAVVPSRARQLVFTAHRRR